MIENILKILPYLFEDKITKSCIKLKVKIDFKIIQMALFKISMLTQNSKLILWKYVTKDPPNET